MCGIVGIWNLDHGWVDQAVLDRFTDSLAHRGPDGRGTYMDPGETLGLGHRRLAIFDTSDAGRQPMSYADGAILDHVQRGNLQLCRVESRVGELGLLLPEPHGHGDHPRGL